jgi:ABC-type arginine/histidine transport system permease subunit
LIEAQREAGEALAGTLKEQLNPSALLLALPAAKAALVALMQNNSSTAAAISIINLMADSSLKLS